MRINNVLSTDKTALTNLLMRVAKLYDKQLDADVICMYLSALDNFDFQIVKNAINNHLVDEKGGMFFPKIADILRHLPAQTNPSKTHPGPNEAWAIAVQGADEAETVVTTTEIMEAWAITRAVYAIGDEVGARMAFLDAYRRIVAAKPAPSWFVSAGQDPARREAAVQAAVSRGLLPAPVADRFRLAPPTRGFAGLSDSAREACRRGESEAHVANAIGTLQALRKMLAEPAGGSEADQAEAERKAFEAHRQRELERLLAHAAAHGEWTARSFLSTAFGQQEAAQAEGAEA